MCEEFCRSPFLLGDEMDFFKGLLFVFAFYGASFIFWMGFKEGANGEAAPRALANVRLRQCHEVIAGKLP